MRGPNLAVGGKRVGDDGKRVSEEESGAEADDSPRRDEVVALVLRAYKASAKAPYHKGSVADLVQECLPENIANLSSDWHHRGTTRSTTRSTHLVGHGFKRCICSCRDEEDLICNNIAYIMVEMVICKSTRMTGNAITRADVEIAAMVTPMHPMNKTSHARNGIGVPMRSILSIEFWPSTVVNSSPACPFSASLSSFLISYSASICVPTTSLSRGFRKHSHEIKEVTHGPGHFIDVVFVGTSGIYPVAEDMLQSGSRRCTLGSRGLSRLCDQKLKSCAHVHLPIAQNLKIDEPNCQVPP